MPPTSYLQAVQTYQIVQIDPSNALTTNAHAIALKRILDRQFWSSLQITGLVGYASTERVKQAQSPHLVQSLDRLQTRLPPEYELFAWQTLSGQERGLIKQQMQTNEQMQQCNPFQED